MVIQSVENAEPLYPPRSNAIFHGQTSASNSFPIEIWEEIFKWLPRSDIKNLLPVPHPIIHAVSSELYWREIYLRLHIFNERMEMEDLQIWNIQRPFGIMTKLLRDHSFAHHVRALKISVKNHTIYSLRDRGLQDKAP